MSSVVNFVFGEVMAAGAAGDSAAEQSSANTAQLAAPITAEQSSTITAAHRAAITYIQLCTNIFAFSEKIVAFLRLNAEVLWWYDTSVASKLI